MRLLLILLLVVACVAIEHRREEPEGEYKLTTTGLEVVSVNPKKGSRAGGYRVKIDGDMLGDHLTKSNDDKNIDELDFKVVIGELACGQVQRVSDHVISCVVPKGPKAECYDVIVQYRKREWVPYVKPSAGGGGTPPSGGGGALPPGTYQKRVQFCYFHDYVVSDVYVSLKLRIDDCKNVKYGYSKNKGETRDSDSVWWHCQAFNRHQKFIALDTYSQGGFGNLNSWLTLSWNQKKGQVLRVFCNAYYHNFARYYNMGSVIYFYAGDIPQKTADGKDTVRTFNEKKAHCSSVFAMKPDGQPDWESDQKTDPFKIGELAFYVKTSAARAVKDTFLGIYNEPAEWKDECGTCKLQIHSLTVKKLYDQTD